MHHERKTSRKIAVSRVGADARRRSCWRRSPCSRRRGLPIAGPKTISRPGRWSAIRFPPARNDIIGSLQTYTIRKGDTLLDVARWYGLSPTEVSNANNHMDWWSPPVGKLIVIPTEHILPAAPHAGIVMNIPEMRLYYYYPTPVGGRRRIGKAKFTHTAYAEPRHPKKHGKAKAHPRGGAHPTVIYTFPVGLGRFDWRTPIGVWTIRDKTHNPTWVVPDDIYQEHLERDGEAEHVVDGGDPDNPLGHYRLELTLPMYALHGTNVPWGVGMEVSHGCVRLYPEDIERLYYHTSVGTPGASSTSRSSSDGAADALYVEVHDDLYGMYPGLWRYALSLAKSQDLLAQYRTGEAREGGRGKDWRPDLHHAGTRAGRGASRRPLKPRARRRCRRLAARHPRPTPTPASAVAPAPARGAASARIAILTTTLTPIPTAKPAKPPRQFRRHRRVTPSGPRPRPPQTTTQSTTAKAIWAPPTPNTAPDSAADTDDSDGNSTSGAAAPSAGDASQWRRLPTGALPLE